ncbi:hypothetical protein [Psychromonas sp. KJ10-2]|uniref:hypothetical protein n=1 Tax=Psychromonas sp. KJ10-2 TaxID=3391822 RepID=UPI0039B4C27C
MSDFFDEFSEELIPIKPDTPPQYIKLEDANLVKRDLDTFSNFLKDKAFDKYKLISIIDKQNPGGWTQKNIDPILDKLFVKDNSIRPNWRTVVRWRKKYIESDGDVASLVAGNHKMGNRTKRVDGDSSFFNKALERFLDAKRPKISIAYQYYKDLIIIANENIVDGKIPTVSYNAFNKRIKSLPLIRQPLLDMVNSKLINGLLIAHLIYRLHVY